MLTLGDTLAATETPIFSFQSDKIKSSTHVGFSKCFNDRGGLEAWT